MQTALNTLRTLVPSKKCKKKVIDELNNNQGFLWTDFQKYLAGPAYFYDGTQSQAPIAGTVYHPQAARAYTYTLGLPANATVAQVFAQKRGQTMIAALTSIVARSLTVFFRPSRIGGNAKDNAALLFHEALHGYGGTLGGTSYFDSDIQAAFFGTSGGVSHNITTHIRRNCF